MSLALLPDCEGEVQGSSVENVGLEFKGPARRGASVCS